MILWSAFRWGTLRGRSCWCSAGNLSSVTGSAERQAVGFATGYSNLFVNRHRAGSAFLPGIHQRPATPELQLHVDFRTFIPDSCNTGGGSTLKTQGDAGRSDAGLQRPRRDGQCQQNSNQQRNHPLTHPFHLLSVYASTISTTARGKIYAVFKKILIFSNFVDYHKKCTNFMVLPSVSHPLQSGRWSLDPGDY